ncbi:MAG: single-stranded-DNA-specific exonuclease RecJ [Gammaproteobacteria bacterium]|nr:single-stranded-DNA-specific exonuclease RecJ [Gammaproteobacteria bacterium]
MKVQARKTLASSESTLDLHPVLNQIMLSRGATDISDYTLPLAGLHNPELLLNIEIAVPLMLDALKQQSKILIVGDFDADGATSTVLLKLCLQEFGYKFVDYLVPNRFEFGYGLTPEIVEVAKQRQPALIITVDNGIASVEGVERAKQLGIKVLVTDHHLPAENLPAADCILNPNQNGCSFPSKALAGVGVVFYLMLALRSALREQGWFSSDERAEPNMMQFLDLVALGTVADVVPLDKNNRCLVKHGVNLIRSGRCRAGISTLLDIAGKNKQNINAGDLGFVLGPRLNAAGRLDDMSVGIECLLTESTSKAYLLAQQLDDLNKDRRTIEQTMQVEALKLLADINIEAGERKGICLFNADWHQGVVGILASRLKDKFHLPALVFAPSTEHQGEIKGSARSIPGLHVRDLLDLIATNNPGLLSKFGGHAMAAGLSLRLQDFPAFQIALDKELDGLVDAAMLEQLVYSDGSLNEDCLNLEFAEFIEDAGPWGQHFPEPLFSGTFKVIKTRVLSDKHLKLLLEIVDPGHRSEHLSGHNVDAIAFNVEAEVLESKLDQIEVLYRLQVNEFRGQRSAQLLIEHFIKA